MIDLLNFDGAEHLEDMQPADVPVIEGVNQEVIRALLCRTAMEIALSYVGQKEVPHGSNWGPFVKECLRLVGIGFPAPWCQAVVYRCYQEAAEKVNWANPVVKTGHVLNCWNTTKATRIPAKVLIANPGIVQPGDQFIMRHKNGNGHTGLIISYRKGVFQTVEGNTNNDGGREGNEQMLKERRPADLFGVISYR